MSLLGVSSSKTHTKTVKNRNGFSFEDDIQRTDTIDFVSTFGVGYLKERPILSVPFLWNIQSSTPFFIIFLFCLFHLVTKMVPKKKKTIK